MYLFCHLLSQNSQLIDTLSLCFKFWHLIKQISIFRCLHIINLINVLSTAYFIHVFLILHQHGDTVSKPGPKNKQVKSLPRCHLSAISLQSKNLSKIPQIEAYHCFYSPDFICTSETYFDSTILEGNRIFRLNRYNLLIAHHPSNTKRGISTWYKVPFGFREVKLWNLNQWRYPFRSTYLLAEFSSAHIRAHNLQPHSSTCIDLCFTDQPNLAFNYETHCFLISKC